MEGQSHILVVDDYADAAELAALVLCHAGYQVTIAFSAAEALEQAEATEFDLIVSDIAMPGMSGYELVETLRQKPRYKETPMVAMTGFVMTHDRTRSLEAGFQEHLTKPIEPHRLTSVVRRLLKR